MNRQDTATELVNLLGLATPPIGLAFVADCPAGVPRLERAVPSACTLWREAENGSFFATAEDHFNCPVGALTMGFELPESAQAQLGEVVEKMCGCGYLSPEEAGHLPAIGRGQSGVVYGPLTELPVEPHLALMWVTPSQAMIVNEATGAAEWGERQRPPALGRPACSALPVADNDGHPTLSLGCMGMRTFTEISDDRLLVAVPADGLEQLIESLQRVAAANADMRAFYRQHKAQFAS